MNTYFTNLNSKLNLETLCTSTTGRNVPRVGPLSIIKSIVKQLLQKQTDTKINIRILIIYLLTILGAILFDVTELYFPNFIDNNFQTTLLTQIRYGILTTGRETTVGVTNEQIMEKLKITIENILSKIPTKTCDQARAEAATAEEMGGGRKKTKKNRKHSKNRSIRFK